MPLTLETIRDAASDSDLAAEIVRELGPLAHWIVRPEIRHAAARRQNRSDFGMPAEIEDEFRRPGGCLIPVVSGLGAGAILEEAFLLPLHWKQGTTHDNRLPPGLSQVADQVLETQGRAGVFSLHLMLPGQKGPVSSLFSDCPPRGAGLPDSGGMPACDFRSAFVPLAIALRMLEANVVPDYCTVSTGSLGRNGAVASVGGIREKLLAVCGFPPGGPNPVIRRFFVPEGPNVAEANRAARDAKCDDRVDVRGINRSLTPLDKSLAGLLAASGLEPDPETSPFPVLQMWYRRLLRLDPNAADGYYKSVLYRQIAARFLSHPGDLVPRPTSFVSVVSTPAIIGLAQELFGFRQVLVLYTIPDPESLESTDKHPNDSTARAEEVSALLKGKCLSVECQPFAYRSSLSGQAIRSDVTEAMRKPVTQFLQGAAPGEVMWDTTSGLRLFSLTLEKVFARPGDWMLNIAAQRESNNQLIPFTENVLVWKHGDSWTRPGDH